jgi:hypothetical protein
VTLEAYYGEWSARQVWTDGTRKAMSLAVRSTSFAGQELQNIRSSHVGHIGRDNDQNTVRQRPLSVPGRGP